MTLIISEIGSNWSSLEDLKESIKVSRLVGADCVKLQMYTHEELYGYGFTEHHLIEGGIIGTGKVETLAKYSVPYKLPGELPRAWIPELHECAKLNGIEFMCTAFSPEGLEYLDPYIDRIKVASSELTHIDMLYEARAQTKPVIASVAGASPGDISKLFQIIDRPDCAILYCVGAYPATNVNLYSIHSLRRLYNCEVGYSCHTADWVTPVYAANLFGASIIEKHFKIRDMPTPDNDHSILPSDFAKMVRAIKEGNIPYDWHRDDEEDMRQFHRRREVDGKYVRLKKV